MFLTNVSCFSLMYLVLYESVINTYTRFMLSFLCHFYIGINIFSFSMAPRLPFTALMWKHISISYPPPPPNKKKSPIQSRPRHKEFAEYFSYYLSGAFDEGWRETTISSNIENTSLWEFSFLRRPQDWWSHWTSTWANNFGHQQKRGNVHSF